MPRMDPEVARWLRALGAEVSRQVAEYRRIHHPGAACEWAPDADASPAWAEAWIAACGLRTHKLRTTGPPDLHCPGCGRDVLKVRREG